MDASVREKCDEILLWRRSHGGNKPVRSRDLCEESRLAVHLAKLQCRCSKALDAKPSGRQLNQDEVRYFKWCLSDAALREQRPSWMASASDARQCGVNAASDSSRVAATVAGSSAEQPATTADLPAPGLCPQVVGTLQKAPLHAAVPSIPSLCTSADETTASPVAPGLLCPQAVGSGTGSSGDAISADPPPPPPFPNKRLRQKPPAHATTVPSIAGLCFSAEKANASLAAPGLCQLAAGGVQEQPMSTAQQLTLRGLNIQYPFSQLILLGAKPVEARGYPLGHRNIANANENLFLIETPGHKNVHGAVVDDLPVGPPPDHAQVIGTVSFCSSDRYANKSSWKKDRCKHCIKEGGRYDWNGEGEMHAWHVDKVQRFDVPVSAGTKSQTGYATPRTLEVTLSSAIDAV